MKYLARKENLIKIILILYTLSIILDLHVFYNSISTLIRVGIISFLFLIIFFKYANKKEKRLLFLYFGVLLIYVIFHMINITNNEFLAEILYFVKMSMSITTFFVVYKLDIGLTEFKKIINICILLIGGSIVFCNIFKMGYSSYSFEKLQHNIFTWFTPHNYEYFEVSGKGYFHLANQIIAIILLYLPIILLKLKEKMSFYNIGCLIIALLSLLILGNRIATGAPIIVLLLSLFLYVFLVIIKKEKMSFKYVFTLILVLAGYCVIAYNSPLLKRETYYDALVDNLEQITEESVEDEVTEVDLLMAGTTVNINFPKYYYPYKNDPEFWDNLIKLPESQLIDSRFIETKIVQRVVELNENQPYDSLLGIGYNRIINIQNIERDYIMQYYSLGMIGSVIVLGIYFVVLIKIAIKILLDLEKFNYSNLLILMGVCLVLVAAYFSGNLLNSISIIIPLSFVLGICYNEVNRKKTAINKVLGFNVTKYSHKDIVNMISKDISNNEQNVIYNINPLIVTNFYQDKKIVSEFNKQKYNIPDGIGTIMALRAKGSHIKNRIAGVDLVESICEMASSQKYTIYLYGSKEGVAKKAKEELERKYINIKIIGVMSGYVDEQKALKDIIKKKPDILFVALGSPKQELFIINNLKQLHNINLIMPVGGSLDVISKTVKRAPKLWGKLHLEWLYRMIKEPKRIKQNLGLVKFVFLVIFRNTWYNKKEME